MHTFNYGGSPVATLKHLYFGAGFCNPDDEVNNYLQQHAAPLRC